MSKFKPTLAVDVDWSKIKYPCILLPKLDGVRGLNQTGELMGRSGKKHVNIANTEYFTKPQYIGFDGELTILGDTTGENLCSETSSLLRRKSDTNQCQWNLFDYVTEETAHLGYADRYQILKDKVAQLDETLTERLQVISAHIVNSREEVEELELMYLEQGYEGIILRSSNGAYKFGRTTQREGSYLRLKRFVDSEILVTGLIEGQENKNIATKDKWGRSERSTHAENMSGNGQVGTILGTLLEDVIFNDKVIFEKGLEVKVSPGKMPHKDRVHYFNNPELIVGQFVKFQHFPIGIKDKPRFPTFQCFRDKIDMGEPA